MRIFFIICISLVMFSCEDDNLSESQNNETFVGDVTLSTQEEVENFGMLGYDSIDGSLVIGNPFVGFETPTDIVDLQQLSQISNISGSLSVRNNPDLSSLLGINNIVNVGGDLDLTNNNISGIELNTNLTIGGGITIWQNNNLQNSIFFQNITEINGLLRLSGGQFDTLGFSNLNSINQALILDSTSMNSLQEFSNLNSINGGLFISSNDNLISLQGLEGITNINGTFSIVKNESLQTLEGLNNLVSLMANSFINQNNSLYSLDGLENLTSVQDLYIGRNSSSAILPSQDLLTDFCALSNLVNNGNYNSITIENNEYNPTVEDIINGNCSQ